jgi:hypothetical protein
MKCDECKAEVIVVGETAQHYELVDKRLKASTYDIPFKCNLCGAIKFSHKAIRGVVFVWPLYKYDKRYGPKLTIVIPENVVQENPSDFGIILSFGKGYYSKKEPGKFNPITNLFVGMKVAYDKTVPWGLDVKTSEGVPYYVKYCDYTDIWAEVVD